MLNRTRLIAPSPFFNHVVLKSWWVLLFFMLALFLYDQGSQHQKREKSALTEKLIKLTKEKEEALALQEDLHLQITSQEDPEYIEMILMRKLGLIQEGQVKLLFQSSQAQE